jgi:hypothetical protein
VAVVREVGVLAGVAAVQVVVAVREAGVLAVAVDLAVVVDWAEASVVVVEALATCLEQTLAVSAGLAAAIRVGRARR